MRKAVIAKLAITASDGKTCRVNQYDLDVIISVCYCVKSLRLQRQCSHSRTLKAHLDGALLSLAFPAGVLTCARLTRLLKKPRLREAFMAFPAGVLTCAHLARREKRTDLSVLYGACSAVLTYTNLKKRTSTVRF